MALASCAMPASTAEPVGKKHIIEITGFKFVPENVDVEPGDTITWVNLDIAPHTATSEDGSWDTGTLNQNESKSLIIGENMMSAYLCRFHPSMTATITVKN